MKKKTLNFSLSPHSVKYKFFYSVLLNLNFVLETFRRLTTDLIIKIQTKIEFKILYVYQFVALEFSLYRFIYLFMSPSLPYTKNIQ